MQFTRTFGLARGLSCLIHQRCCSTVTLVRPGKKTLMNSCKQHGPCVRQIIQNFLGEKHDLLPQNRWVSSHVPEVGPSHDPSADPASSEPTISEEGDATNNYQALKEELAQMRNLGRSVPENISDADLEYYSSLTSKNSKKKFLNFLFKKEAVRKKEKLRRLQKRLEKEKLRDNEEDLYTTLPENRLFRRFSNVTALNSDNWRLASAMKFGPQIAYDFSFDDHMVRPEVVSMVSQLTHVLNANKVARDPFYVHWTGLKEDNSSLREMRRMFCGHYENLMVNTTQRDVLEMFPKEKLIYLTADSRNIMHTFDVDKVYIVGGLVDSRNVQTGVTLAKAKRYNISHARFPLDLYLQWEMGAKTLTLDQVARILHTLHETGDWVKALEHVPTRKHGGFKISQTIDSRVQKKIEDRQELWQYYQQTKGEMERGRARKETVVRDGSRFAFSRAKREFKWDLVSKSDGSRMGRSDMDKTVDVREISHDEEHSKDYDPTGDTLFDSSRSEDTPSRGRGRRRGAKWYEDV